MNAATLEGLVLRELQAARDGDTAAFSRIVAASQNTVTAIALAITRDVATSEDIAQEAFLSAWQNLRRLQNPASFLPWLRQITRNLARDHLRGRGRRAADIDDAEAVIAAAADPGPTPCERLVDEERQRMAAELISALPDDSREVLLLYYREGQRSQQVALLLGLSDAAVRKRLSRARATVRDELLARFGEFARDTAPSAAFTLMVTTALSVASPPAAAAGLIAIGGAAGAKTFGKLLLGSAGAVGVFVLLTFGGMWLGLRRQLRGAVDDAERAALKRNAAINAGVSVVFMGATLGVSHLGRGWIAPLVLTVAFVSIVGWRCMVIEPRILARRHALEACRDPAGAARRRRRERLLRWAGLVVGSVAALGGIAAGLMMSGRL